MMRAASIHSQDDPLTLAMRPPDSETDSERTARVKAEAEAKWVSEKIDEELKLERQRLQKSKDDVKVRIGPRPLSRCSLFTFVGPHILASVTRSSRVWKINPTEAIPIDV